MVHDLNDQESSKFRQQLGRTVVAIADDTGFMLNDVEEVAPITYIGKENQSGDWLINKIDETSGTVSRYASAINNPLLTTYTSAWTNKASLTYGTYSEIF